MEAIIVAFFIVIGTFALVFISRWICFDAFDAEKDTEPNEVEISPEIPKFIDAVGLTLPLQIRGITPATCAQIFVSYRRDDSADIAGRIYDRLLVEFGRENVFKDVDSIPLGVDFKDFLETAVSKCDIFLAIIGPKWMGPRESGQKPRIWDDRDFVRIEIASALERKIPVIPVLVSSADQPNEEDLPSSVSKLSYLNSIMIRRDPDFHNDMARLVRGIEKLHPNPVD